MHGSYEHAAKLMMRSSYWIRYSPLYGLSYVKNCFVGSAPPIFLTEKASLFVQVFRSVHR